MAAAFDYGVRLIDGQAWVGLAGPLVPDWRTYAVRLTEAELVMKEERQPPLERQRAD